jgi:molecular chaperone GrpE (heat shock protein)
MAAMPLVLASVADVADQEEQQQEVQEEMAEDEQQEMPPPAHAADNEVNGLLAALQDPGANRIAELKAARAALLAERKRVAADLRNEERKRQRLLAKARNLNNEDLIAILGARVAAKAKAKGKAKAKAKAAA